jgi:hypothetical protein
MATSIQLTTEAQRTRRNGKAKELQQLALPAEAGSLAYEDSVPLLCDLRASVVSPSRSSKKQASKKTGMHQPAHPWRYLFKTNAVENDQR